MGRQHHRMDRTQDGRGDQTCRRQGRMETTGFQLIIGAPTATAMGKIDRQIVRRRIEHFVAVADIWHFEEVGVKAL